MAQANPGRFKLPMHDNSSWEKPMSPIYGPQRRFAAPRNFSGVTDIAKTALMTRSGLSVVQPGRLRKVNARLFRLAYSRLH
jgi:hypothetical protein